MERNFFPLLFVQGIKLLTLSYFELKYLVLHCVIWIIFLDILVCFVQNCWQIILQPMLENLRIPDRGMFLKFILNCALMSAILLCLTAFRHSGYSLVYCAELLAINILMPGSL